MLNGIAGPVLALDAGNALFRNAGVASDADKARAAFILDVMGRQGTRVAAVGQRDLSAGAAWLEAQAKASKVKWLSANLARDGKPLFDASTVVEVAGAKVAVIGLTAPGPVAPEKEVQASATLPAAQAALAKLGKRDLTILLAATSYADALQLSVELAGQVDFVIQSGEFRGTQPMQRMGDKTALVFASAQRGQALAKVAVSLGKGQGPFVDLSESDRDRQQLEFVGEQLKRLEERLRLARDPASTGDLKKTVAELKGRQKALQTAVARRAAPGTRTVHLEWAVLGQDVPDDPPLKEEVLKHEPTYAGSH